MEFENKNLKVGGFVLLGIFVSMAFVIVLGSDHSFFNSHSAYKIYLKQAQGITRGSIVSLLGIKVGNVRNVSYKPDRNKVVVDIEIFADYKSFIRSDIKASVRTQGALGDKYIFIEPGSGTSPEISSGGSIPADESPGIIEIVSENPEKVDRIFDVIEEAHLLFKQLNDQQRIVSTLHNMESASKNMSSVLAEIRMMVQDVRAEKNNISQMRTSVERLASVLKKVDEGKGTLGALINNSQIHDKILSLLGGSPRNTYLKPLIRSTIKKSEAPATN